MPSGKQGGIFVFLEYLKGAESTIQEEEYDDLRNNKRYSVDKYQR